MRHLGRVAVGAFRLARLGQVVMGPAGGGAALGVASFWIRHRRSFEMLSLEVFQGRPAIVDPFGAALAVRFVPVLSTGWAYAPALLATNPL